MPSSVNELHELRVHPAAAIFPLLEGDALLSLAEDIRANGLREPILLDPDGSILDGRNRFLCCKLTGIEPRYQTWNGEGSRLALIVSLNLHRRHLDVGQRAMIGARIFDLYAVEAKQRQGARTDIPETVPESDPGDARDKVAAAVGGVSGKTVDKARKVIAQGSPDVVAACYAGKLPVALAAEIVDRPHDEQDALLKQGRKKVRSEADNRIQGRRKSNQAERAATAAKTIILPSGKYHCIVADPPWPMEKMEREKFPNQVGFPYPSMTEAELRALPVSRLAYSNCHLYLCTTHKHLPTALALAEAWGFRYECLMTWVKNVGFTPFSWMRSTEHVLFCRRGKLDLLKLGMRLDFSAKVREHSRKPQVFYDLVREASPGPRLDMFSREEHEGFETWGNETDKFTGVAQKSSGAGA